VEPVKPGQPPQLSLGEAERYRLTHARNRSLAALSIVVGYGLFILSKPFGPIVSIVGVFGYLALLVLGFHFQQRQFECPVCRQNSGYGRRVNFLGTKRAFDCKHCGANLGDALPTAKAKQLPPSGG
jgi:hypothetical protein